MMFWISTNNCNIIHLKEAPTTITTEIVVKFNCIFGFAVINGCYFLLKFVDFSFTWLYHIQINDVVVIVSLQLHISISRVSTSSVLAVPWISTIL